MARSSSLGGQGSPPHIHLATAAAIAVVAYAGANLAHEILGHCGAAAIMGGGCSFISTADIRLSPATPLNHFTIIALGGSVGNIAAAGIGLFALRRWPAAAGTTRLFLWLIMAINLFVVTGYMALSPLIHFGDWQNIIATLDAPPWSRAVVAGIGMAAWLGSWALCRRELRRLIGTGTAAERAGRALLWTGYAVGSAVMTGAALLSALPLHWALLVGLGSTAGLTTPLLILPFALRAGERGGTAGFALPRHAGWLVGGAATAIAALVVGRGFSL